MSGAGEGISTRAREAPEVGAPLVVGVADTDTVFLDGDNELAEANEIVQAAAAPVARPVSLRPGELIPGTRYRLLRWLGDGGMGTVFEALQVDLDRRVALKVLRSTLSPVVADLFRAEAKVLGRLESRFVVDVYDLVELADGRLMIAMELLQGETLRNAIKASSILPVQRIVVVGRQICKGLGAAHRVGIVHRDVKPENICIQVVEDRVDTVKLLDFGIAQVGSGDGKEASRAGTPGYLAPEVISGLGGDARSDVYALGCVLYECISGRRPFDHPEPSRVLLAQLSERPIPPSTLCDCPASLERVILRCLEKEPLDRFADMAALEAALCQVQIDVGFMTDWDDLPLPAVDAEAQAKLRRAMPAPARRLPKRRWLPWAVSAAVLVAVCGVGVGYALRDSDVSSTESAQVESLVAGARAAGARAFFVYAPPEEPRLKTALAFVLELEGLEGDVAPSALQQAEMLRREFADTLERLGDEYWDAEGGKPFALDYYAEALLFDPARTQVRSRAAMTPGEFRLLRSKAEAGAFSKEELSLVEPLIVLSDVSDEQRASRLASIEKTSPRASERRRQLRRLSNARRKVAAAAPDEPVPVPAREDDLVEVVDVGTVSLDVGGRPDEVAEPAYEADPSRARELVRAAGRAHAAGNSARAEALYAEALAADRGHAAAHRGLGRVAFDRGSYALAARRLKKAVRLAPRTAEFRIALGDALYKSFDYEGAQAQYSRAEALGSKLAAGRLAKVSKKRK